MPYFPPIQQDQYPATDETQCIQIIIPAGDEFKALLAGLIVEAGNVDNYADPTSAAADGLAAIWDQAYSEIDWSNCPVPENVMLTIDLFCVNATPLAGVGTLTYTPGANLPFGYTILTQDVALYGMTQPVWLRAGEYDYIGWYAKTTLCGNTGVALTDAGGVVDTIVATFNQAGSFGAKFQATGSFTVPADGFYNVVVANVSPVSGNEQCSWISHHIRQTA